MQLLAGDIGGTNTRLAIYRVTEPNRYDPAAGTNLSQR